MNAIVARYAAALTLASLLAVPASAPAQSRLPRYEPVECFEGVRAWAAPLGVECGWLIVPELRERPNGPTVKLPVARLRAREPDGSPPLVYLHGGPGGQGQVRYSQSIFAWPIARHRDIVVYDHRGAGLAEPRLCPEAARLISTRPESPTGEDQEGWNGNARECVAELEADGIEPLAYTTQINLLDLIDLRRALGYERWDVYGVSYGGVLAQEAMRQDARAVRAAVLAYSGTVGPTTQVESALSYQRSLDHLFDACARQSSCRAAFPSLAEDFQAVFAALETKPVELTVERTSGPAKLRMDGDRFVRDLRCQLGNPRNVRRVPLLVHDLRGKDRQRALEILAGGCGAGGFNPTLQLVMCHAVYGDHYPGLAESVKKQLRPEFHSMVGDNPECRLWQERFAEPWTHDFVESGIPTLLITGEFDDRSPTEHSRKIAESLSFHWIHEMPGESHGGAITGCHASILFEFLEDPERQPDPACIDEMPRIAFETANLTSPTLLLNITAAEGATSDFAGTWEAEIPDSPQLVRFDLTTDGATVAGALRPQELEVFDGRVKGNTLRMRIKSPDGLRTITFTGELRGDEIHFTREVEIPAGAPEGGRWIFGAEGAKTFTARRPG
jgi:pimeloyl-ACP methyl ester carboxylesterase